MNKSIIDDFNTDELIELINKKSKKKKKNDSMDDILIHLAIDAPEMPEVVKAGSVMISADVEEKFEKNLSDY